MRIAVGLLAGLGLCGIYLGLQPATNAQQTVSPPGQFPETRPLPPNPPVGVAPPTTRRSVLGYPGAVAPVGTAEERQLADEINTAAMAMRTASSKETKEELRLKVHGLVEQWFDLKHKRQVEEVKKLKDEIAESEDMLKQRETKRGEIVDRKVDQLLGSPDLLQWDATIARSTVSAPGTDVGGFAAPNALATMPLATGFVVRDGVAVNSSFPPVPPRTQGGTFDATTLAKSVTDDSFFNQLIPAAMQYQSGLRDIKQKKQALEKAVISQDEYDEAIDRLRIQRVQWDNGFWQIKIKDGELQRLFELQQKKLELQKAAYASGTAKQIDVTEAEIAVQKSRGEYRANAAVFEHCKQIAKIIESLEHESFTSQPPGDKP